MNHENQGCRKRPRTAPNAVNLSCPLSELVKALSMTILPTPHLVQLFHHLIVDSRESGKSRLLSWLLSVPPRGFSIPEITNCVFEQDVSTINTFSVFHRMLPGHQHIIATLLKMHWNSFPQEQLRSAISLLICSSKDHQSESDSLRIDPLAKDILSSILSLLDGERSQVFLYNPRMIRPKDVDHIYAVLRKRIQQENSSFDTSQNPWESHDNTLDNAVSMSLSKNQIGSHAEAAEKATTLAEDFSQKSQGNDDEKGVEVMNAVDSVVDWCLKGASRGLSAPSDEIRRVLNTCRNLDVGALFGINREETAAARGLKRTAGFKEVDWIVVCISRFPQESTDCLAAFCKWLVEDDLSVNADAIKTILYWGFLPLMNQNQTSAPRNLFTAVLSLSKHHPRASFDCLFSNLVLTDMQNSQAEILCRVARETFTPELAAYALSFRMCRIDPWTEAVVRVVEVLFDMCTGYMDQVIGAHAISLRDSGSATMGTHQVTHDEETWREGVGEDGGGSGDTLAFQLVSCMEKNVESLKKSVRLSKMALNMVTRHPKACANNKEKMKVVLLKLNSFLAKSALAKLEKLN